MRVVQVMWGVGRQCGVLSESNHEHPQLTGLAFCCRQTAVLQMRASCPRLSRNSSSLVSMMSPGVVLVWLALVLAPSALLLRTGAQGAVNTSSIPPAVFVQVSFNKISKVDGVEQLFNADFYMQVRGAEQEREGESRREQEPPRTPAPA